MDLDNDQQFNNDQQYNQYQGGGQIQDGEEQFIYNNDNGQEQLNQQYQGGGEYNYQQNAQYDIGYNIYQDVGAIKTSFFNFRDQDIVLMLALALTIFIVVIYFILQEYKGGNQQQQQVKVKKEEKQKEKVIPPKPKSQNFQTEICSICLCAIRFEVEANCRHVFCAECLVNYWISQFREKLNCPICRRAISHLKKNFKKVSNPPVNFGSINDELKSYNFHYSGEKRSIADTPFYVRRTWNFLKTRDGVISLFYNLLLTHYIFILILYIAPPLELLPKKAIDIIGILDDICIGGLLLIILGGIYYNYTYRSENEEENAQINNVNQEQLSPSLHNNNNNNNLNNEQINSNNNQRDQQSQQRTQEVN